jgi:hypothetical protein
MAATRHYRELASVSRIASKQALRGVWLAWLKAGDAAFW